MALQDQLGPWDHQDHQDHLGCTLYTFLWLAVLLKEKACTLMILWQ